MPAAIGWPAAAGAVVGGEASERALRLLGLPSGATVFMDGASGGVGTVAVQFARAEGLTVIASGAPEDQDYLRELGAVPVTYGDGVADRSVPSPRASSAGCSTSPARRPAKELISLVRAPSQDDIARLFGAVQAGHGRVDAVYASAGIGTLTEPLETVTTASFDDVFGVNVRGTLLTVQRAVP